MPASVDTPATDDAPPAEPTPRSTRPRVFAAIGAVFALLAVTFAGLALFTSWQVADIERHDLALADVGGDEPQNYLIVGSDSRAEIDEDDPDAGGFVGEETSDVVGQRADVIMVARVDPVAHEVHLLSLPRDLWVPIAGTDHEQRINTAYSLDDGRQRLIDTIEQDFDIPIHHYVEVDFRGFEGIVESLDGIPLVFDRPVRDQHSGLLVEEPGCRVLDGREALAFARSRHLQYQDSKGRWKTDGTGDLGRIARQQVFMRAVVGRAAGEELDLGDLGDGYTLLTTVSDYVGLDAGLDVDLMLALANEFKGFGADGLVTYSLPVEPFTTDGGAAVLEWQPLASQDILNVFRGAAPGTIDPALISVEVWNGSGIPGQAGEAQDAFEAAGFEVEGIDDAPATVDATVVRYAPGLEGVATAVARHLELGATLEEDDSLSGEAVVVVTGPEFGDVLAEPLDEVVAPVTTTTVDGSTSSGDETTTGSDADPPATADEVTSITASPSTTSTTMGLVPVENVVGGC